MRILDLVVGAVLLFQGPPPPSQLPLWEPVVLKNALLCQTKRGALAFVEQGVLNERGPSVCVRTTTQLVPTKEIWSEQVKIEGLPVTVHIYKTAVSEQVWYLIYATPQQ